jgi:hypothetical protein
MSAFMGEPQRPFSFFACFPQRAIKPSYCGSKRQAGRRLGPGRGYTVLRHRVSAKCNMLLWIGKMNMLRYIVPGGATLIGAMLIGMILLAIAEALGN